MARTLNACPRPVLVLATCSHKPYALKYVLFTLYAIYRQKMLLKFSTAWEVAREPRQRLALNLTQGGDSGSRRRSAWSVAKPRAHWPDHVGSAVSCGRGAWASSASRTDFPEPGGEYRAEGSCQQKAPPGPAPKASEREQAEHDLLRIGRTFRASPNWRTMDGHCCFSTHVSVHAWRSPLTICPFPATQRAVSPRSSIASRAS